MSSLFRLALEKRVIVQRSQVQLARRTKRTAAASISHLPARRRGSGKGHEKGFIPDERKNSKPNNFKPATKPNDFTPATASASESFSSLPRAYRGRGKKYTKAVKLPAAEWTGRQPNAYHEKVAPGQPLPVIDNSGSDNAEKTWPPLLVTLVESLLPLAREYGAVFSRRDIATQLVKKKDNGEGMESIREQLKDSLDGIHKSETPIELSQILKTEDMFREISRLLQDLVRLSAKEAVSCKSVEWINRSLDLGELALRCLVALGSERALVVDSARKRIATLPPQWAAPLRWVKSLFNEAPPLQLVSDAMAHKDPNFVASANLFHVLMGAVASTVLDRANTDRDYVSSTASRVIALLEILPPTLVPIPPELGRLVLEMFSRAGTLESAQASFMFFQGVHHDKVYRFSLVLQAYIEAAKYEEDDKVQGTIASQSLEALNTQWSKNYPSHEVERVKDCSLVLQCFAIAKMGATPGFCELADGLVMRALTEDVLSRKQPKDGGDTHLLPLLHYLIHVLASSEDPVWLERSKQMLLYMMQIDRGGFGFGASIVYPTVDTLNVVIQSILKQYEDRGRIGGEQDLEYTLSLLDYMFGRSDQGCWPNDTTFLLLLRLLAAIKPNDISDRAENMLSKMELRRTLSRSNMSLSTYHLVLRCWLAAAESGISKNGCLRGMKLLENLEMQSTPLILSDKDVSLTTVRNLYDISLRPSKETYNLLLKICAEAMRCENVSLNIPWAVVRRMAQRGMLSENEEAIQSFLAYAASLPEDRREKALANLKKLVKTSSVVASNNVQPGAILM
jgi:hypothetical protein